jgi:uncharacterized protein YjbI with pentapeptide repeats
MDIKNSIIDFLEYIIGITLAGGMTSKYIINYIKNGRNTLLIKRSYKYIEKYNKSINYKKKEKYIEKVIFNILDVCDTKPQMIQELIDFIINEFFKKNYPVSKKVNSNFEVDKFAYVIKKILTLKCKNRINEFPLNIDLSEISLISENDYYLENIDLENVILKGSKFTKIDFSRSSFRKADLSGCIFKECNLDYIDINMAIISNLANTNSTEFNNCSLEGINFNEAAIKRLQIIDSDIEFKMGMYLKFYTNVDLKPDSEENLKDIDKIDSLIKIIKNDFSIRQKIINFIIENFFKKYYGKNNLKISFNLEKNILIKMKTTNSNQNIIKIQKDIFTYKWNLADKIIEIYNNEKEIFKIDLNKNKSNIKNIKNIDDILSNKIDLVSINPYIDINDNPIDENSSTIIMPENIELFDIHTEEDIYIFTYVLRNILSSGCKDQNDYPLNIDLHEICLLAKNGTYCENINFENVSLWGGNFHKINFSRSSFINSDLGGCLFSRCGLEYVNVQGAIFNYSFINKRTTTFDFCQGFGTNFTKARNSKKATINICNEDKRENVL